MSSNQMDRLEAKVDRIDERLDQIDKHLERYNVQLEVHIKRNDAFEEALKPVVAHMQFIDATKTLLGSAAKVMAWTLGIATGLVALWAAVAPASGF